MIDLSASTRRYNLIPTRGRCGFYSHPQTQINLLPVEVVSEQSENNGDYDLQNHDEKIYPRPGHVKPSDVEAAKINALHLYFEDCADEDKIEPRLTTRFDLKVGTTSVSEIS